jgi:hypothetical protein
MIYNEVELAASSGHESTEWSESLPSSVTVVITHNGERTMQFVSIPWSLKMRNVNIAISGIGVERKWKWMGVKNSCKSLLRSRLERDPRHGKICDKTGLRI